MRRATIAGTLILALAAPAAAEPAPPRVGLTPIALRSADPLLPTLASGASTLAPVGVLLAAMGLNQPALVVLAPFGFGAGQAIAGDARRGLFVGSGGLLALGLGLGLGWAMSAAQPKVASGHWEGPPDLSILYYSLGIVLATLPYGVWAGCDAWATAWRAQGIEDPFAPAPVPLPPAPWLYGQVHGALPRVPAVTFAAYEGLAEGTTYEAIAARLGRPGEERRWRRADDRSEAVYRWTNQDGSYMELTFVDGKLAAKANRDLR